MKKQFILTAIALLLCLGQTKAQQLFHYNLKEHHIDFEVKAGFSIGGTSPLPLPEEIRYAIVAGAVTGGGLTVIANAPNPAGQAILGKFFKGISATWLFLWVLLPTAIFFLFFNFL